MHTTTRTGITLTTVFFLIIIKTNSMAQVIDPAADTGIESHVKGFLQAVNAATPMPVERMPVEQARGTYAYATTVGEKPDLSGVEITEQAVEQDGISVKLHFVRPAGVKTDLPAFLYFHGGIWFMGDFETHKTLLRDLVVRSGLAAVF